MSAPKGRSLLQSVNSASVWILITIALEKVSSRPVTYFKVLIACRMNFLIFLYVASNQKIKGGEGLRVR